MSKKTIIGIITAAAVLGGALVVGASSNNPKTSEFIQNVNSQPIISSEMAKEIALDEVQGTIDSVELDDEMYKQVYEVEVNTSDKEIEMKIDAKSGEIIKKEIDDDIVTTNNKSSSIISVEQAIKIAEKKTGAKVKSIEKDYDDGKIEYEIELMNEKGQEIEMTINARTGKISELEYDDNDEKLVSNVKTSKHISIQEARNIAEAKTGAKVKSIEKEWDDGRYEYDMELVNAKGQEIEITMDATTGKILKFDMDDADDDEWDD
ncbi:PepSY domain-containing protein [Bacillus kwashiorkori]|uniref:PepSY domain-containing protein n=1 Tax=Bacillus kwashiorkori TaxID=1522318 RepID=UPI000782BBEA|nr:PepSY domain-containing protein [Bacillus kwashiorkori]